MTPTSEIVAAHRASRRSQTGFEEEVCAGFPEQLAYVKSTALRSACFTPRRSGKTTAFALRLARDALRFPRRKQLYLGQSKESAENCIWTDCLEKVLNDHKIEHDYSVVKKVIKFPNGSTVRLGGMDSSPRDMRRLLGGKYHRAIIDECQSVTQDLAKLVGPTLTPAVSDYLHHGGGYIELGGTPGLQMGTHFWWGVTRPELERRIKGWAVHSWPVEANPHMRAEVGEVFAEFERTRGPGFREDPDFRREWLGEWVLEDTDKVYAYDPTRNLLADAALAQKLLRGRTDSEWTYVIGCDLGWEDPTAFVVVAYSRKDPRLFVVESEQQNHMPLGEIGKRLSALVAKFGAIQIYVDSGSGTGKLAAESLAAEHAIPVKAAEKKDKYEAIGRLNSDFRSGLVQVVGEKNGELCAEWQMLTWDQGRRERGEWVENKRFANHLADAALYAHRDALHAFADAPEPERERDMADEINEGRGLSFMGRRRSPLEQLEEKRRARAVVKQWRGLR